MFAMNQPPSGQGGPGVVPSGGGQTGPGPGGPVVGGSMMPMTSPAGGATSSGGQVGQQLDQLNQQPQQNNNEVSLSVLIDYLVQRIFHDLQVRADLLPRQTDMERKVEIFKFASRTRMLFVRLLALVKWASSVSKVDKSSKIMDFLDRQSLRFTDTADQLAQMARERLVNATLPNFHLPAAVEVLTTGYYSRIPKCVRDRIVPPKAITAVERKQTLLRLNQVIEHRLVTTQLPLQMRNLKIENGRVTFIVKNEFAASLTLMGDGPQIPWHLLKIEILVEDQETGEGKALVHPLQISYLESMVQQRLASNETLDFLYSCLHQFCQSLQLEVLQNQTLKLCMQRLGRDVRIEEYKPGRCLTVSYWRELMHRTNENKPTNMQDLGYRFSIQVDPHDPFKPLSIVHMPPLNLKDSEMTERVIRSENLSMERLLVHSIYVRTRARLQDLKTEIQDRLLKGSDNEASLHGTPPVLSIPILQYCLKSELLLVTIDTHTGIFMAHVPQYDENPYVQDIQNCLNDADSKPRLEALVSQLRFWMTKQRVKKTLQQLPATSYERLPILFDLNKHPLKDLSPHKMYIRLHRQPNAILIVEIHEKTSNKCEMDYTYYFLWVKPASIEDDPKDDTVQADIPKVYLKALSMVEFDSFLVTHGPETKVDAQDLSEKIIGKRKLGGKSEIPFKRTKYPAYFIYELAHVVAFADEQIPFNSLAAELTKKGVSHSGVQVLDKAVGLELRVIKFPKVENVSQQVQTHLHKFLLNVVIRMGSNISGKNSGRFWRTELAFVGNPVAKIQISKPRHVSYLTQEVGNFENMSEVVDNLVQEWDQIVHLFELVDDLEDYLSNDSTNISDMIDIKTYTFRELILEYGPEKMNTIKVKWNAAQQKFNIILGGVEKGAAMCPHSLIKNQLEQHLNQNRNLALLGKILHETYGAIKALSRLPSTPVTIPKINPPVQTFAFIAQSPTHYKVIFYSSYCLDIYVRSENHILIRDGAISLFNQAKAVEDIQPIQNIKNFLLKYMGDDEAALQRRQSQAAEDDNPPSPLNIGGNSLGTSGGDSGSDQSAGGLKFQAPHTPPSNPLTPASPHGILQSPPGPNIRQPSPSPALPPHASPGPSNQPTPSPGFMVPSPVNNPASLGSPFPSAASPLAAGSPSMPRPSPRSLQSPHSVQSTGQSGNTSKSQVPVSRLLPQRLWAGATPTPLTAKSLDEICKPSSPPPTPKDHMAPLGPTVLISPLNRFLGCVYLRRFIQHHIRQDQSLTSLQSSDPPDPAKSVIMFRVEGLTCRVISYASNQHQSLHLKLEPDQAYAQHWNIINGQSEMIQILERFFDSRVAIPPFRLNAVHAFCKILQSPIEALKDIINILRYEMRPELETQENLKWSVRLCLTVPPAAPPLLPIGQPGLLRVNKKMLMFFHLTRTNTAILPQGTEPLSVVIPIVYDIEHNQTSVAQKEQNPIVSVAQGVLTGLAQSGAMNMQRCTIMPCVRELLTSLRLPNEGPDNPSNPMMHPMARPQMGPGPMMQPMGPGTPSGGMRMMNPGMMPQQRMMGVPPQQQQQQQHGFMG